jgi:hypothetical protein
MLLPCWAQAQLALGAMGFPVLGEVLREERDDVEMVVGALECLTNALAQPAEPRGGPESQVPLAPRAAE